MRNTEKNYTRLLRGLSKNIRVARARQKLRQADMIEFGFSERYMQKLESGKYSPNLYTVHRLSEALKVSVSDLFKAE
jgi:DNA-binding XRE family transcriptional regulator